MTDNLVQQHTTSDGVLTTVIPVNSDGSAGVSRRFEVRDEADTVLFQVDASGANTVDIKGAAVNVVASISQTIGAGDITDNEDTTGTITMTGQIPAGATVLGTKVLVTAGFAEDESAVMTIGDGVDVDRYHASGTLDVFTTAATGIESGAPNGAVLQLAAVNPVIIMTTAADFSTVAAGDGAMTVTIYYLVDS